MTRRFKAPVSGQRRFTTAGLGEIVPAVASVLTTDTVNGEAGTWDATELSPSTVEIGTHYGPGGALIGVAVLSETDVANAISTLAANIVDIKADMATEAKQDVAKAVLDAIAVNAAETLATALDAAGIRGAIGMAEANLDTQLDGIALDAAAATVDVAAIKADYQKRGVAVTLPTLPDVTLATTQASYAPAKAGDAMTLTSIERTNIGTAVWASATRTLTSFGTLVASIWTYTLRTLSGTSGANAPTAATADCDIYATAFKGGTVRLCARVYKDGEDIKQADVSTITYSIYLLDDQNPDTRTVVTGHSAVSLLAADVLFDTLQSDSQASNYNFKHVIPISAHAAFTIADRHCMVEYVITPTTGEKIIARFKVQVV